MYKEKKTHIEMNKNLYYERLQLYNFKKKFVLKCLPWSMYVYHFLYSEKFCVEWSIWICQALNFMEWKLSSPFWSMSGFNTGLLLLIHSQSVGKRSCSLLFSTDFWHQLKGYFCMMKYQFFYHGTITNDWGRWPQNAQN